MPVDRARFRATLVRQVTDDLRLGVEWNPADGDVGPLANWRVLAETERRPALIVGTSSARIGTDSGRAIYATLSKDLERWTGLPIAPYAGASWDGADHRLRAIGGLSVRWHERVSSMHFHDGVEVHHTLTYSAPEGMQFGLILADVGGEDYLGVSYGISF